MKNLKVIILPPTAIVGGGGGGHQACYNVLQLVQHWPEAVDKTLSALFMLH